MFKINKSIFFLVLLFINFHCFASIHPHGYWLDTNANNHIIDKKLAKALAVFFTQNRARSIVDLGCGIGTYTKVLIEHQFYCEAYDGNPNTPAISDGIGQVLDLSKLINLHQQFDWVLSLEVGEHIPNEFENKFIKNLIDHARTGIVLSWAVIGQGGHGHVNERSNEYIKKKFNEYGFYNDLDAENSLRNQTSLPWFKNTIMVFRKK